MAHNSTVDAELGLMRQELNLRDSAHRDLSHTTAWRPVLDILTDWMVVLACCLATHQWGAWIAPLCMLVIGNRQRALGNILHDAAHRTLSGNRRLNDAIATALVAPALLADLSQYRRTHARHHAMLGDALRDPDYVQPLGPGDPWLRTYLGLLVQPKSWWASFIGHLGCGMPAWRLVYLVGWWAAATAALAALGGWDLALVSLVLWFLARATTFHAITAFRELCDHFAMSPGGIFSFTRDIATASSLRWLIHPYNNGYHLTHHLLPAVPYYKLARAHARCLKTPSFCKYALVCDSYFGNERSVIRREQHVVLA